MTRAELTPAQLRLPALGSVTADRESELFAGIIDRVVDAAELVDEAIGEARRLMALPAFDRVKHQRRRETLARIEQIVERDDEPLRALGIKRRTDSLLEMVAEFSQNTHP